MTFLKYLLLNRKLGDRSSSTCNFR